MSPRAAGWAVSLLLVALSIRTVRAAESPPKGLSYLADPSCPDQPAFADLVLERAPLANVAPMDFQKADVLVALQPTEGRFVGTLQIRRRGGSSYAREVHGTSCSEVGPAIAFILALALTGQGDAPSESSAASADTPGPNDVVAPPARGQANIWGWGFGATIGARAGIAPSWSMTEQGFVEVRALADALWTPTFRIAVLHAEPVIRDDGVGTTTFSWIAARGAGCIASRRTSSATCSSRGVAIAGRNARAIERSLTRASQPRPAPGWRPRPSRPAPPRQRPPRRGRSPPSGPRWGSLRRL